MRKKADAQDEYQRQYVERCLAKLTPANQGPVREYLRDKEAVDHNKPATLRNHAVVLLALDRFLAGTPITTASPEQLRDHHVYTEWQHASLIKAYLRVHCRGQVLDSGSCYRPAGELQVGGRPRIFLEHGTLNRPHPAHQAGGGEH